MAAPAGYLIDTNILLRLSRRSDPQNDVIAAALTEIDRRRANMYVSPQNIAEFWNVCTRPADRNGYGLSIDETERRVAAIEGAMTILPDNNQVYGRWRALVRDHAVRGVQVHDARLAAIMQVNGVSHILTLNKPDFLRYAELTAVHPTELTAGA